MSFSSALRLTDLDDFIKPSVACILPDAQAAPSISVPAPMQTNDLEEEYSVTKTRKGEVQVEGMPEASAPRVKINLTDCLACSGCVTTAESVLVEAQSVEELVRGATEHTQRCQSLGEPFAVVISLASQAVASLAARFGVPLPGAYAAVSEFARAHLGATHVIDLSMAARIEALHAGREFVERYRAVHSGGPVAPDGPKLPLLCSTCPGWVCYAEKRHGEYILPYMSTVRSPQQVLGALLKRAGALPGITSPTAVYHGSLMMCYDKKLEASRGEYMDDLARDVDCVVTTSELVQLMEDRSFDFASRAAAAAAAGAVEGTADPTLGLHGPLASADFGALATPSPLESVLRIAARELFGVEMPAGPIELKPGRNPDFREITVASPSDPTRTLRFAVAHGFRNIQTVVRAVKKSRCSYDYVEVLACPGGCLNGGGQAKPGPGFDGDTRALLAAVRSVSAGTRTIGDGDLVTPEVLAIYERAIEQHAALLTTSFRRPVIDPSAPKAAPNPLTLQW